MQHIHDMRLGCQEFHAELLMLASWMPTIKTSLIITEAVSGWFLSTHLHADMVQDLCQNGCEENFEGDAEKKAG